MKPAFYMRFLEGHNGRSLDRLGGLPTHLPERFPRFTTYLGEEKEELAFIAQFYCTPDRINLPGTLCVQLYQDSDVGEGGDPLPVAIKLPLGAKENTERAGVVFPGLSEYEILWDAEDDPDVIPDNAYLTDEEVKLMQSKAGGIPYYTDDELPPGHIYLFQLCEEPADFNFAGRRAIVSLAPDGSLYTRLQ